MWERHGVPEVAACLRRIYSKSDILKRLKHAVLGVSPELPRYHGVSGPLFESVRNDASLTECSYTASFAFFEAIWEAGITHCFVNLGSDHPSIIEAIVKGQNEKKGQFPRIITCPNEVSRPSRTRVAH
ncbi:hypothetical protein PMIN06_000134 [Paraphaeosphaeria minitans]